jgi:hypothetical protein
MPPVNNRILVKVDMRQKNSMKIGDVLVSTAMKYEVNGREKSPVIALVVMGNQYIKSGQFILCHHNHFYPPSPYYVAQDEFSIPANHTIFAILTEEGDINPVYGNVICERVPIETTLPLPPELRKHYTDRGKILNGGWTKYKTGDLVFTRPSAPYDIVYIFGDIEKRVTKINSEMICAVVKGKYL